MPRWRIAPVPGIFGKNDARHRITAPFPASSDADADVDGRPIVLDGQARDRHVPEALPWHDLDDLVATRDPSSLEDADRADTLGRWVTAAFELERIDRRPVGPCGAVGQQPEHGVGVRRRPGVHIDLSELHVASM